MKKLKAKDVMNSQVVAVDDTMSAQEAARFLTEMEISGAPVVSENGKILGVVTLADIALGASEGMGPGLGQPTMDYYQKGWEHRLDWGELREIHIGDGALSVQEIMTPTVYTVTPDTPVSEIAETMISGQIHRLFVTTNDRVVGIITTLDLLKLLVPGSGPLRRDAPA